MASGGLAAASEVAVIFLIPSVLAIAFVFTLILLSWYVAWTMMVHVPLVQEISGLRPKKPSLNPKPANRGRAAKFYQNQAEAVQRSKFGTMRKGPGGIITCIVFFVFTLWMPV